MTNAILEHTTIESQGHIQNSIDAAALATPAAAPDVTIGRTNPDGLPTREITQSTAKQGQEPGLLGRSINLLRNASFGVGLTLPGKLWYRESPVLNVRDKAAMDTVMRGFL